MTANRKNTEKQIIELLAERSGLAIVVADGKSEPIDGANNNSMCRALYNSKEFAARCQEFCGHAFERAIEAGKTIAYECHAGLSCKAVPIKRENQQAVAIIGRTFLKAADYRRATERAIAEDWKDFSPTEFFENVLLTGSAQSLEKLAGQLEKLSDEDKNDFFRAANLLRDQEKSDDEQSSALIDNQPFGKTTTELGALIQQFHNANTETFDAPTENKQQTREEPEEIAAWRSLFGALLKLDYRQACRAILEFLHKRYAVNSLAWFERREDRLEKIAVIGGSLENVQVAVAADDERLNGAARRGGSLVLEAQKTIVSGEIARENLTLELFPFSVAGEIRGALAVSDRIEDKNIKQKLARFCRTVASELEILRLRSELSHRVSLTRAVEKFNENLKKIDSEDFWLSLTQISAEILRAERASLLFFNEKSNTLLPKAVIGAVNDLSGEKIGARIAQTVLENGNPLVVADLAKNGIESSPLEWQYKTDSFISYPIFIGERKVAVMNFTDRADRSSFGDYDLELLQSITPQIAVAIDRASLKDKAGKYEQLSVTDELTGLLNKRYLKERLTEEIKRSERHGFPMSFMMIDVDEFKPYNDNFGHLAGDDALKIVGAALKEGLRGADVAARFGGEEFSILLPQTMCEEAVMIAERIRQRIETTEFPKRKVTISIGVACSSSGLNSPDKLIEAADQAVYEAKRKGRNNVQTFDDLTKSQPGK